MGFVRCGFLRRRADVVGVLRNDESLAHESFTRSAGGRTAAELHLRRLRALAASLTNPWLAPAEIARLVLDEGFDGLRANRAALHLVRDDGALELIAHVGMLEDQLRDEATIPPGCSHPAAVAARTGASLLCPGGGGAPCMVAFPIGSGSVLGAMTFEIERASLDEGDQAFVDLLSMHAAHAFERASWRVRRGGANDYEAAQEATRRAEHAARRAEEASRLKDEFLATVSHELRTPLSSILGWATLLRTNRTDPTFVEKGLEVIERNARAQQRIIEDILDVSRIVTGKLRIDTELVDLERLAGDILETVRPTAFAKDVAVTFERPRTPCLLGADSVRLRQVLWNLLSNAVKFTPGGGRVWLAMDQIGDRITLHVGDTGRGIDPAFLPHVFERFRQADSSTTREHGGLGLGLAIVRHLTEMHGGTVSVASEGLGKGSVFTVVLPVRPFSAPVARAAPQAPEAPRSSPRVPASKRLVGLSVLVVEDERDSRDLIELLLSGEGAEVQTAASADGALAALEDATFDIVLSDVGMPGRDGYWLARELRKTRPGIATIALTAYSSREDVMRALAAGFDRHVAKPVDPELLVRALEETRRTPPRSGRASSAA
jgi:signal transduction histidine kinase/ActR/RegA family two-component response regulator